MLFVLLSDLHWVRGPQWSEIERVHGWIADDIAARAQIGEAPTLVVIAGDVFDQGSWPIERNAAAAWVQRLASHAPVVILRGNHDRMGDLDLFARLRAPFSITVYDKPAVHIFNGGAMAVAPWVDRVGGARSYGRYSAEAEARAEVEALRLMLDGLGRDLRAAAGSGVRLFAGHLMVRGARTSHGQPQRQSKEFEIGLDDLARVGAQAYMLGHVHLRQAFTAGGAPVIYNGSTRRTAFGELEDKCYTRVFVAGDKIAVEPVVVPTTPMLLVEDRWEGGAFTLDADKLLQDARGAQVRLSYEVQAEDQVAARTAADALRAALESVGATLKPVPRVLAPPRSRAAEIVMARTITEKFDVWCGKVGKTGSHVARARELLVELEQSADLPLGGCRGGGARLHRVRVESMVGYDEPVELDIDALPGRVTAVLGSNGVGKSLLLGCWPGTMYGEIPADSHPDDTPLAHYAVGKDAIAEAEVDVGGSPWILRHKLGRGKVFAINPEGAEQNKDGKATSFHRWAKDNLLPASVFRHSIFCPQGSEGLVKLRPGNRREVLLEALGLEGIKPLAERARRKAGEAERAVEDLRKSVGDTAALIRGLPAPETIAAARAALGEATSAREGRRAALAAARADPVVQVVGARGGLAARREEAEEALSRLEPEHLAHAPILAEAPAIRAAQQALRDHEAILRMAKAERARIAAEQAHHEGIARSNLDLARQAADRMAAAAAERASIEAVLRDRETVLKACIELPGAEAEERFAAANLLQAERARRATETARAEINARRLLALREALSMIAQTRRSDSARAAATAALATDTTAIRGLDGPSLMDLDRVIEERRETLAEARQRVADRRATAARLAEMDRASARATVIAESEVHERAIEADARARAEEAQQQAAVLARGMPSIPPPPDSRLAGKGDSLAAAERAAADLETEIGRARARLDEIDLALAALPPAGDAPDLAPLMIALDEADQAVEERHRALVLLEEAIGRAAELKKTREDQAARLEDARLQQRAWALLSEALGPKGIPLYEIDALGPELTAIANDLLHTCYGPRFTVDVDTQRPHGTEKRFVDEVMIWVYDAETGAKRDARAFNAGARFFSGLAVSLALAVVVCARAGAASPTIVRDEHAAGLSPENRAPAMGMLRRACDIIGAKNMIIVTHDREFAELADCAVVIERGRVEIRHPVTF